MFQRTRRAIRRFGLRWHLGVLAGVATGVVIVGSAYLTVRYFSDRLLDLAREASVQDSEELRGVLETQMASGDRTAIRRLVADIGHSPGVAWVGVLDGEGRIRISSDPASERSRFPGSSLEMARLRSVPSDGRAPSETLLREGCSVLRTLTPLHNRAACASCHDPAQPLLGALIVDRSLAPLTEITASSGAHLILGGGAVLVVLLGTLGLALERTVLGPLGRLREATARLGRGDFGARARDPGPGELGELAGDFDAMAARLEAAVLSCAAERQQLGELVEGISDGVVLLDRDLRVVKVNRAFRARLGADAPLPPGLPYATLAELAGVDAPDGPLPAVRALASGRLEKAVLRVTAGAGERVEEIYAQPLADAAGATAAVIEVWRDISERAALQAGLEDAERLAAIGLLASSVAHEVGNPLASIVTAVDGLLLRLGDPRSAADQELREYLEIIRRQAFRCRAVTERLLGFARVPGAGAGPADAAAAVREVLTLVAAQARSQRVELRLALEGEPRAAVAEHHLQQIVLNLVLNALRAMPSGGTLTAGARVEGDGVVVRISDTGPGIPPERLALLFQPFRRQRADGGGTGLGLFISHAMAARWGATIAVESPPGQGATFTVRFHQAGAHPAPALPVSDAGRAIAGAV